MLSVSAHSAYKRGFRVSTQTFLEQMRQLWVSIWNMTFSTFSQLVDYDTELRQWQINFLCLFERNTGNSGFNDSFRTSQVNKVKLCGLLRFVSVYLLIWQNEYCVAPRAPLVHVCAFVMHVLLGLHYLLKDIFGRENSNWVGTDYFVVADLESLVVAAVAISQQVLKALHIDFEVVHLNLERWALQLNLPVHVIKEVKNGSRNDSIWILNLFRNILLSTLYDFNHFFGPKHTVSLARATLSICENRAIVTFGELFDSLPGRLRVHHLLALTNQYMIERKSLTFHVIFVWRRYDLIALAAVPAVRLLQRQWLISLEPNNDLDRVIVTSRFLNWISWFVFDLH